MSGGRAELERFLATDPRDVGCDETRAVLHLYAEQLAAGTDPADRYPGAAAHLTACESCAEATDGLLTAISNDRLDGGCDEGL
ncbi:hypothetical protein [Kribbella sp. NPDC003557]|uniref:hypothetical protein n=1 Tax=Kribbella sp. NPDC003557 TaxID=3154449 RepID=UPI0033BBFAFE